VNRCEYVPVDVDDGGAGRDSVRRDVAVLMYFEVLVERVAIVCRVVAQAAHELLASVFATDVRVQAVLLYRSDQESATSSKATHAATCSSETRDSHR